MPIYLRKDLNGQFYQYGTHGHKYYFINKVTQEIAYNKAIAQTRAIHANRH